MPSFNNNFGMNYPYGMPYQPFGYPYGNNYQNNGNYQNNNQGMPQNNNQPMNNQQPQLNQYAFVNGIEGAKSFQLSPNQSILLMDSDNPLCYMKSSNGVGQSTLKYFRLTEVSESELKSEVNPKPVVKEEFTKDYVLKTDFEQFAKKVDNFIKQFEKAPKNEDFKRNKVNRNEQ